MRRLVKAPQGGRDIRHRRVRVIRDYGMFDRAETPQYYPPEFAAERGGAHRMEEGTMPRNVAIGLGLMEFPFSGVGGYWRWVDLCEAGGVNSLWQTDRVVSREPILECMSVMAALAGRTRRLKFGVNVLSLAFRDPVLVAKQCATIDVLSEGRLLPAFGIGSPLGAGMAHPQPRHQDARPQDR